MAKLAGWDKEVKALAEALLGPDQHFRRLIIDIPHDGLMTAYVTRFVDGERLRAALPHLQALAGGARVVECDTLAVDDGTPEPTIRHAPKGEKP